MLHLKLRFEPIRLFIVVGSFDDTGEVTEIVLTEDLSP